MDALPHPSKWPHRPVYLVADDRVELDGYNSEGSLPLGKAIDFETDMFKGRFYLRLCHAKPHPDDAEKHAAYFDGVKRFYQFVIQGQFKEEGLTLSDIVMGDVYERKLKGVPHGMTGKLLKKFVEALTPGIIFDIFDDKQPKVLAPMGGCQTMSVNLPREEPTDFDKIEENTALLGKFASKEERAKILSKPKTAAGYEINTGHVYTLEAYDHTMDFGTFHQHFGSYATVDLIPSLDGQTLSLGMYTRSLRCICNFSLWHERAIGKQTDSSR